MVGIGVVSDRAGVLKVFVHTMLMMKTLGVIFVVACVIIEGVVTAADVRANCDTFDSNEIRVMAHMVLWTASLH